MGKELKTLKQTSNYELDEMLNMAYDLQVLISKYKHLERMNKYMNMNNKVSELVKSISNEIDIREEQIWRENLMDK